MSEVKLLPLPEGEAIGWTQAWSYDQMRAYARANMEPLIAENEALRAEVRDAYAAADSKAGWEWRKRAERLEEALRYAVEQVPELATVPGIAAALDQEGGNG